ncbi:Leucine-rich repeat-containing protein [Artemisia annua]|uniref:Leucine-rich repeat-containing protein n=1 Tax=Artemisia annua TaxID=35608 RepID=A0A2U1P5Q6_ARTAN|nr:Leucine-rich repeat-containing protein [Artemisia annua]
MYLKSMSYSKSFYSLYIFFSFAASSTFLCTSSNTTAHKKCSAEESHALILFKQSLFSINDTWYDWKCPGYHSILMNWNTSTDCCNWEGVTCDHSTNDVVGLDLSCGMLRGNIHPNNTLFHLRHLQRLNLAFNYFTSELPGEIGRFSNSLTHFNITDCWFSGQVPTEITHLHKLVSLDLSLNMYDFKLRPRVLSNLFLNLSHLEDLSLEGINISSVLPIGLNISSSSSLKLLNLRATTLQGKLPPNIFKLQSLETLDLSDNSFSGDIPWEISLLPKLVSLHLSTFNVMIDNLRIQPHIFYILLKNSTLLRELSLSQVHIGSVLPTYFNITSVRLLDLSYCGLRGFLPNSLVNLRNLIYLNLSANKFRGIVPSGLFTLPSLETISLYNNMLSGNIPFESFVLPALKSFDFGHNQFDGHIDFLDQSLVLHAFQQLSNLTRLDLSFNKFKGDWELETLLSSLPNLVELHLSYSGFSVITINSDANYYVNPSFDILNLASCKLKVFPESLRAMRNLSILDLSRNEIRGEIPLWAGEIGGLQLYSLDLSYNFITSLPQFHWYNLYYLYLQSNLIQGPFPLSICNISYLSFLDMSNNYFNGEIPQCFGNIISSLALINLGNNSFHGTIPKVHKDCGGLEGFILNGNQLQGEVPSSLSKCQSLKVLDLGNNLLNGTFPIWLERLLNLQVLVLKSNKLHGTIETSSSTKLQFQSMRILDLSHNGFSGQLPQNYFQNFNAMKRLKRGTNPEYLNVSDVHYSIIVNVKGGTYTVVASCETYVYTLNYLVLDANYQDSVCPFYCSSNLA